MSEGTPASATAVPSAPVGVDDKQNTSVAINTATTQYNPNSNAINNMISNGQNNSVPISSNTQPPPADSIPNVAVPSVNAAVTQGTVSNNPQQGLPSNGPPQAPVQQQSIPPHIAPNTQPVHPPTPGSMANAPSSTNTMSSEMPGLNSNQTMGVVSNQAIPVSAKAAPGGLNGTGTGGPIHPEVRKDKRAHHTALERKRRDHIKDKFAVLHKEVPGLQENDKVSRSNILTKATDYIIDLSKKNDEYHDEVERLKRQNLILQQQIDSLETGKIQGIEHEPEHHDGISGMNDQMSDLNYGTSEPGIRPLNEPTINDNL